MMSSLLNEDNDGYAWEGDYEQTWAAIEEDERGQLRTTLSDSLYRTRKKQMMEKKSNISLSMLRHMYIVIDGSSCMVEKDLKPSRILCILKLLEKFIFSFFDQNPISQIGILITRNKVTEKICNLMGNPRKIVDKLKTITEKYCQGEPSIQNSLDMAVQSLKYLKSHSSREVLFIMGSLSTCDPGDVFQTINECKAYNVRCSVIGLSAEVHCFRYLTEQTLGLYTVILDELHLNDIMQKIAFPLPNNSTESQTLIRMGFPQHKISKQDEGSMCMCHLMADCISLSNGGYFCPQCDSKYCEIPIECKSCGLMLVCAPHLARSYHHLFPLEPFDEVSINELADQSCLVDCFGCQDELIVKDSITTTTTVSKCKTCHNYFCLECDIFIHETMHSCPGCCSQNLKSSN